MAQGADDDEIVLIDASEGDEEDDDMADLFSFGSPDAAAVGLSAGGTAMNPSTTTTSTSLFPLPPTVTNDLTGGDDLPHSPQQHARKERSASDDSFLELLESVVPPSSPKHDEDHDPHSAKNAHRVGGLGVDDDETREILNWLEEDDRPAKELDNTTGSPPSGDGESKALRASSPTPPILTTTLASTAATVTAPAPTVVSLPPLFLTLSEALQSDQATSQQLVQLAHKSQQQSTVNLTSTERAELYCRILCHNKSKSQVQNGSLADSFVQFREQHLSLWPYSCDEWATKIVQFLKEHASNDDTRTVESVAEDLQTLLAYYFHDNSSDEDVLIPPVAAALLAIVNGNVSIASVLLHQIVGQKLPVLALQPMERWDAALLLHQEWYLLATYHIPLLVYHLDRYLPGWYWPKAPATPEDVLGLNDQPSSESVSEHYGDSSSLSPSAVAAAAAASAAAKSHTHMQNHRGCLPLSWLLSHMAGEFSSMLSTASSSPSSSATTGLSLQVLLTLWDQSLIIQEHASAWRFFLVLAVLEHSSDDLLLLTGEELAQRLHHVVQLTNVPENWWIRAKQLQEWTPESVWIKLVTAEDRAVQQSLQKRQERAQRELQAKLEAEAEAHRIAQEQKANAARERLTRARLVAFYRKHAPDKEANIDKIMQTYGGDWDVLDAKLKLKYGEGFNPPAKKQPTSSSPFLTKTNNKLISTMNTGLGVRRNSGDLSSSSPSADGGGDDDEQRQASEQVSVLVAASEVLPVICWTKQAAAARGQERRRRLADKKQLKFYLVDSRPEEAAAEQGRFPTAVALSPEAMLDPDRLKENEEMFESLRGAVHIVVMGEGFAALPYLYGHKLTPKLEDLMREDESRTNICALFFVKKGFPFVSILNGGFAAAHSWLVRNGTTHHLNPSAVLVDYDPEASLFGQLETLHNATATEKAQRKMQALLDRSLMAMTRRAQQLERLAAESESKSETRPLVRNLFGRSEESSEELSVNIEKKGFSNPFASVVKSFSSDDGHADTEVQRNDASQPTTSEATKSPEKEGMSDETMPDVAASSGASKRHDTSSTTASTADASAAQNRFSMFRGSGKPEDAPPSAGAAAPTSTAGASTTAQQASSMLKGLGAALNQSIKATDSGAASVLKRNPFARFGGMGGGGGVAPQTSQASTTKPSGAGAGSVPAPGGGSTTSSGSGVGGGWNQLRRAAMARMRVQDSGEEESISFDAPPQDPDTGSDTSSASADPTAPQVQKV